MAVENLNGGRNLQGGSFFSTRQLDLAADTYHVGMLLEYAAAGTAATTGTGNGVAEDISADASIAAGVYTCTFTAPLVCDLTDPDGNLLATALTVPNGSSLDVKIGGLTFTLTDGSTAWIATDTIAITIPATGVYQALDAGVIGAIYNGTDGRVLSSAGVDNCVVAGEVSHTGIVDASGSALVLTAAQIAAFAQSGFYIKEV